MSDRTRKPYSRPAISNWLTSKPPSTEPTTTPAVNNQLLVSNLHYEVTPKDLTSIFGQIGTLVREPLIKYDRSGRSSGVAIIAFETTAEAIRARKQYDGILAKDQPMKITFDTMGPPRHPRRAVSAPTSLLNRIQKAPLLDRLGQDKSHSNAPVSRGFGPIRTRPRGPAPKRPRSPPKKPKTAEELDKELDAFMGDAEEAPAVLQQDGQGMDMA